ncbi:hypothetical protein CCAX7_58120 [Capsulimonas corticalis]|uniref:Uncharacterized protein n=1 Tax=Capsulimonas corticalis TaxID=2219043 RepID=A0A402D016_9BACT|nr:hypothetical protein [Capsulimonas corticalis]BDI33761.1 hypothetical protein CCAX7_58120 [Capsulimonas corticalis]
MQFLGLGNGPYQTFSHGLSNPRSDLLSGVRYQIVPSMRGVPAAQLRLQFRRDASSITNPEMTLAVLLDRSGSMSEAFAEGHVYDVAQAILTHVLMAGSGYDLIFYDDQISDAGHIQNSADLRGAILRNGPRGGTYVTSALRHTIQKYKSRAGLYIIVITDGEFADKADVMQLVTQELLPQVKPESPYAFRLHFVGAGEGVDHVFLRQMEDAATGQGSPLVTAHHHAHLRHSHTDILAELDKAYVGVGASATVSESSPSSEPAISSIIDVTTRRIWPGASAPFGFLPRTTTLDLEYAPAHAQNLPVKINFTSAFHQPQEMTFQIPLPKPAPAPGSGGGSLLSRLHLPWNRSPEDDAARAAQQLERERVAALVKSNHDAELRRQSSDLQALASGGLPMQAIERLKEIGTNEASEILFTSNLAPEEAGLLRREGFHPRGIVTGSAVYHVGQAYASSQGDCEVTVLSEAYNEACRLAVGRMGHELKMINGHGVVGVRFSLVRHEWADKTIEVQVMGTAVEGPGRPPEQPWMCDLSGQEWYALRRAGYDPVAFVWGHCTWFLLTTQQDEWTHRSWNNVEMTHWSAGLSKARTRAMAHLNKQASAYGSNGVAGVKIERRLDEIRLSGPGEDPAYEREHHNIVVSILGTAIRARPNAPRHVTPTLNVLSLRDGRLTPIAMATPKDAVVE